MTKPVIIGLVGGVACGKSTVAREFERRGAALIDADAVGHEALANRAVKKQVVEHFGAGVLDATGNVDRKLLGERVFGKPAELKALTDMTHPWIREQIRLRLDGLRKRKDLAAVVLDISLLLESGAYDDLVDALLFIDATQEIRARRAADKRGWKHEDVGVREAHQMPLEQKRARADFVLDNNGDEATLAPQIQQFWERFVLINDQQ